MLKEPRSWRDAFKASGSLSRTSMFWTCGLAFLLAVTNTTGAIVHILRLDRGPVILLAVGFAVLDAYSFWLALRVFKAAQTIKRLSASANLDVLSDLGALLARVFMFAMIALASGAMAILMILFQT